MRSSGAVRRLSNRAPRMIPRWNVLPKRVISSAVRSPSGVMRAKQPGSSWRKIFACTKEPSVPLRLMMKVPAVSSRAVPRSPRVKVW